MSTDVFPQACQSCRMPIEGGLYCRYCVRDDGTLQPFEERLERMVQWSLRQDAALSREEAERKTRAYMRTMPAWREHPQLREVD